MSEADPRLNDAAMLAAMAFVRRAIEYSEELDPDGQPS